MNCEIISSEEWNTILLFFNAFLWVLTFALYQYKRRTFGAGSAILLLYTSIAIMGIHLFLYHPDRKHMFTDLTLFPYLYLYCMILLVAYPIFKIDRNNKIQIIPPSHFFFNSVCIVLVLLSLYRVNEVFSNTRDGLIMLFLDADAGLEAYNRGAARFMSDTSSGDISAGVDYIAVLSNTAKSIIPLFWMYYLTLEKKNKLLLCTLSLTALLAPLNAIASGSRYTIGVFMLEMIVLFIFLRKTFSQKSFLRIKKIMYIIMFSLLLPFMAVTLSRSGSDYNNMILGVERYTAESFIRFNNYGLDAGGVRYGDRTIPLLKVLSGMDTAKNYAERLEKYSKMKINESVFYTFVGDFTLDYGPILTILIFLCVTYFYLRVLRVYDGNLYFYQFILLFVLIETCLGFFLYLYADVIGNLRLVAYLFAAFVFKVDYILQNNKTVKNAVCIT